MRINVYSEEMAGQVELIRKVNVVGADGKPTTFHGLRVWLLGPDTLHRTEHDDDRPAVTFWFHGEQEATLLADQLRYAANLAGEPWATS